MSTTPFLAKYGINTDRDIILSGVNGWVYSSPANNGDVNSGFYLDGTNNILRAYTNKLERFRVDASGNFGINTTTMAARLDVRNGADGSVAQFRGGGTRQVTIGTSATTPYINADNGDGLGFSLNSVERGRFDSSGRLLITTNTSRSVGGAQRTLQIETTTQASFSSVRNTADTVGPTINLGKTRSAAIGGVTAVVSGDELGSIQFAGADGTTLNTNGASIQAYADAAVSTGVVPTRFDFSTMNSAGTSAVRLRLKSGGDLSIRGGNLTMTGATPMIASEDASSALRFGSNGGVEAMRITSGGLVGIGTSGPTQLLDVQQATNGSMIRARNSATGMEAKLGTTANSAYVDAGNADLALLRDGTEVMRMNGTNVAIGTTSAAVRLQVNADIGGGAAYFHANSTPSGNQRLWMIGFGGGTDVAKARIEAYAAAAWTAGTSTPTYLGFNTTPSGVTNSVERMRIDQDGNVGIGGAPTSKLHVFQTTAGVDTLMIRATNGTVSSALTPGGLRADGGGPLQFFQGPTEAMRIDTTLNVVIGTASRVTPTKLNVQDSMSISNTSGTQYLLMGNQNSGGTNAPSLLRASNGVLSIGVGDNWSSSTGGTMAVALSVSGTAVDVSKAMTVLAPTADMNPATKKYVDDITGPIASALAAILGA